DVGRKGLLGVRQGGLAHAGGGDDVRLMHDEQAGAVGDAVLGAAVLEGLAGGELLGGGLGDGNAHGVEAVAGVLDVGGGGVLGDHLGVGGDRLVVVDLLESGLGAFGEL